MESNRVDDLSASLKIDCPKLSVSLVVFKHTRKYRQATQRVRQKLSPPRCLIFL
jgi:hypothetical protein